MQRHTFDAISLIIGIIALVLAIPLGIAGNLLAPKVREWWVRHDTRSLLKYIDKLEKEYAELDGKEQLRDPEVKMLEGLERIILILCFVMELGLIVATLGMRTRVGLREDATKTVLSEGLAVGIPLAIMSIFYIPLRRWRRKRTRGYHESLAGIIEELKSIKADRLRSPESDK